MADPFSQMAVRTNNDGDVVVGIDPLKNTVSLAGGSISIDGHNYTAGSLNVHLDSNDVTVSNTVDVNLTNTSINASVEVVSPLPTGSNIIGKVEVVDSTGIEINYTNSTSTDVLKQGQSIEQVESLAITDGLTGNLKHVLVSAPVQMKAQLYKIDTTPQNLLATTYIPVGGGSSLIPFEGESAQITGTIAAEKFIVTFKNLDFKSDSEAHAKFLWIEQ